MKNYWRIRRADKMPLGKQIDRFMRELWELAKDREIVEGDFRPLYNKYPKVRIGIRSALRFIDSTKRALRRINAENRTDS